MKNSSQSHFVFPVRPRGWVMPLSLILVLLTLPAFAQRGRVAGKAKLGLAADRTAYEPGATARLTATATIDDGWHIQSHEPTFEYLIPTVLTLDLPEGWRTVAVEYPEAVMWTAGFAEDALAVYEGTVTIHATVELADDPVEGEVDLHGELRYQACDDTQCLPPTTAAAGLSLTVGPGGEAIQAGGTSQTGPPPERALGLMLALAVLGGLILNAMPCVLPVLSLKIFGLVKSAGQGRAQVVSGALATAAGILFSFWALGLVAAIARATGQVVGWGVQFQNPGFVTFLTIVVILFCLNLWGLFEVPLPRRLAQAADSGARSGIAGHFTSGLFATLMATPCSAPFLGTAMGFGLSQEAPVIFAIFTCVGLGMAAPYLVLAAAPRSASLLPKPGAWMDHLKGVMGFLLAGAAIWLLYVLAAQVSPERLALLQGGLLGVALFIWLHHRLDPGRLARRVAALGILAAAAGTLLLALDAGPVPTSQRAGSTVHLIDWTPFDRPRAEGLAGEGRLVFVDVTADWCFTCKVNERLVLETPEVAEAFRQHEVIAMKADWTNRDDSIGEYLAEFGRAGIPFYLLYRPGREPHLFGELLTKGEVLTALAESAWRQVADGSSVPGASRVR